MRDLKVEGLYAVGQTEGRVETVGDRTVYNRVGVACRVFKDGFIWRGQRGFLLLVLRKHCNLLRLVR